MKFFTALASALAWGASLVEAQAVFAHFMVGNTKVFGLDDWKKEITLAKEAGIDAFALNMANNDPTNEAALPLAFDAAASLAFKLFFSFDYAGNGPWAKTVVIDMIKEYGAKSAYYKRGSQAFVSTFEGPGNAADWVDIKTVTGCFFIPDWSSLGAQPAVGLANGVADGLFSWDAWPKGPADMTTYPDASYYDFLGSKPYMMPISPWFYTNLPGYGKNWLWRGDDLWFQRWQQAITIDRRPDYIQIISWNDYGESHYIGPLDDRQYEAFDIGRAPYNYVKGMPHDGWRETLPYYISMYKTGRASIAAERLVSWYRVNKNGACSGGGTTGNTANQLQLEYSPNEMMQDRIFYDALLIDNAQVQVSIGGAVQEGKWDQEPHSGVGVYHGSVPIGAASGPVIVTLKRGGTTIAAVNGASITSACTTGLNNYNPWVGSAKGPAITPVTTPTDLASLQCVKGFGVYEFTGVCDFACSNGYCPSAACTCLNRGVAHPPNETGMAGYPLPGKSGSFKGLCSFNCNHGYCPDTVCGQTPNDGVVLGYSPFLPPACTGGSGTGAFQGLCDFGCHLGFCPMHVCTCLATGVLVQTPPKTNITGYFLDSSVDDHGLCKFACEHGYCPDVCGSRPIGDDGGRDGYQTVTLDPAIWGAPTAQCAPPCVLVLPPITLTSPTTISFNQWTTSLEFGWWTTGTTGGKVTSWYTATIISTVLSIPPVTTNRISLLNEVISTLLDGAVPSVIYPTPSVSPPPFVITPTNLPSNVTATPVPRTIRPPPWPWSAIASAQPTESTGSTSSTSDGGPIFVFPTGPFPTTAFPTETVSYVTTWVSEPTTTQVDGDPVPVIPCWVWFIWVCPPNVGGIVLSGFKKPGIYPPGGPPPIAPGPPGLTLKLPWPQITVGPDIKPTYPQQPDPEEESCQTATADVCTTTLSYGVVAKRSADAAPTTDAPSIIPFSEFRKLRNRAVTTTTSTISFCTRVTGCGATDITKSTTAASTVTPTVRVVIPRDPKNVAGLRSTLKQQLQDDSGLYESQTNELGTIFFFIPSFTDAQTAAIRSHPEVADAYIPKGQLTVSYWGGIRKPSAQAKHRRGQNGTEVGARGSIHAKRAELVDSNVRDYIALLSWPPNTGGIPLYADYKYDSSAGEGTYVYSLDFGAAPSHPEFSEILSFTPLFPQPFGVDDFMENDEKTHGTGCLSKASGKTQGIARKARLIATVFDFDTHINEHWLDGLAKIHEDIYVKGRGTKAVVNFSVCLPAGDLSMAHLDKMAWLIREIIKLGAVITTGSCNNAGYPSGYPALFGDPSDRRHIPDLIVVGAVKSDGVIGPYANADWVTCYAPGFQISVATSKPPGSYKFAAGGTSYASATVAGLAAYFRGLDPTLTTVASVKQRILSLTHRRQRYPPRGALKSWEYFPDRVIWNGQQNGGSIVGACKSGSSGGSGASTSKRDGVDTCPVQFPPQVSPVSFRPGPPQPTCTSGDACGNACKGFYCERSPLRQNPDFLDPRNPDSVQNPDSPYYGDWDGTKTRGPTSTTATTSTTSTKSPTSTPNLTPLTRGPIRCFSEADFPGHGDIQSGDQDNFAVDFSGLDDVTIGPGDAPIRLRRTDGHGINYDYRAEWVAGCVTTVDRQSFRFPLGMSQSLITAYLLVREDYTNCNNGGVGGSCQAGCLLYTFEGGRGGLESCLDFDCRECGSPFDPDECGRCCQSFRVAAVPSSQYPPSNHSHYVPGEQGGSVVDDLGRS